MNYLRLYGSESKYENETRSICEYTVSAIDRTYFVHWQGADSMSPSEDSSDSSSGSSSSSSEGPEIDYMNQYFTMVALEAGEFKFIVPGSSVEVNNVEYSRDEGLTWVSNSTTTDVVITVSVNAGDRIMWRCVGKINYNNYAVSSFRTTCKYDIEGNITSLGFGSPQNNCILPEYAYTMLFTVCEFDGSEAYTITGSNTNLRYAHNLYIGGDLTQMSTSCCANMFDRCTYLATMPNLLSISLALECYSSMFYNCSSLNNRDPLSGQILNRILPANILPKYCYSNMFRSCTSLISTPQLGLNSSALYEISQGSCYFMFKNCTSLTTIVGNSGYLFGYNINTYGSNIFQSMFQDCSSLISCPYIKFTTYYDKNNTIGSTQYVCSQMFYNCQSLQYVDGLSITSTMNTYNNYICSQMFAAISNSPASTNFWGFKDSISFLYIGGNYCYAEMFSNCTKLKVASDEWENPATNKLNFNQFTVYNKNNFLYSCYKMFYNCTSLQYLLAQNSYVDIGQNMFDSMFLNSSVIDVSSFIYLNSTTLMKYTCWHMFMNCTQLVRGVVLSANNNGGNSVARMYYGCSNLNYIDASGVTNWSVTNASEWVYGVAPTGTFIKKAGSSNWPTGINGIPSGWTVQEV